MNAKDARKLATEMAPVQAEKDRLATIRQNALLEAERVKKAAEEQRKFDERYVEIIGQIEWAAKKGRTEAQIDFKYEDDKVNILKRLHLDGYKAYQSIRYYTAWNYRDEYPDSEYTAEQGIYKVEW